MKHKKLFLHFLSVFCLLSIIVLTCTACSGAESDTDTADTESEAYESGSADSGSSIDLKETEPQDTDFLTDNYDEGEETGVISFIDDLGYDVSVSSWERVVSLYGSFAETWILAGGSLAGTTNDAITERELDLGDEVAVIGTVQDPSLEEILALSPDFIIMSADTEAHVQLHEVLSEIGIAHAYYRVDSFDEYLSMLEQFCGMTGRWDLYEENGLLIQSQIQDIMETVNEYVSSNDIPAPTCLLLRAFSTGAKAKGLDNLAGVILADLGVDNLITRYESLLEDVSLEEVIAADPDYIFVVTMGSEEKAQSYMKETFEDNPAWNGLSAVQNGRYILLPRDLFHYKPNNRWAESYAYLAEILYPELSDEISTLFAD